MLLNFPIFIQCGLKLTLEILTFWEFLYGVQILYCLGAKIRRNMIRIRFSDLNLVFNDESFPLVASLIKRSIKVDTNTLRAKRGSFERICVEIDLTQLVVGTIWIQGHWYYVEYEGLQVVWSACGCFGHLVIAFIRYGKR